MVASKTLPWAHLYGPIMYAHIPFANLWYQQSSGKCIELNWTIEKTTVSKFIEIHTCTRFYMSSKYMKVSSVCQHDSQ